MYRQKFCKRKLVLLFLDNADLSYSVPVNLVYNGAELLLHLAPKIWELVPNDVKAFDPVPDEIMETSKIFLNNLQNQNSANWLCVVSAISHFFALNSF